MIIEAAKKANEKLLLEEETPVEQMKSAIRGGRIVARAFLKPAPILLLDEATSALDAITNECSKSLDGLAKIQPL